MLKKNKKEILFFILPLSVIIVFAIMSSPFAPNLFTNRLFRVSQARAVQSGDLIKMKNNTAVYYLGDDNKRYVFPSEAIYFSWYKNFDEVITISQDELQSYQIGGNIHLRAGTKLIKIMTDPSVYAVEPYGVLRKIQSESQARSIYGDKWADRIIDLPDSFFTNYTIGEVLQDNELPIASLAHNLQDERYYYYDGDSYRNIISAEAFKANNFYSDYVITINRSINNIGNDISGLEASIFSLIKNLTNNPLDGVIADPMSPDLGPPVVDAFVIPETSNSYTVPIINLGASDNVAVTGYLITESNDVPNTSDQGWLSVVPINYTFSSVGSHTLYAWAKDAANNVSAPKSAVVVISIAEKNLVYIDPSHSNGSNENGSLDLPYNSFTDFSIQDGYSYLLKRGTTYASSQSIRLTNKNNVTLSTYGVGDRPKFAYAGTGGSSANAIWADNSSNFRLLSWEVYGTNNNIFSLYRHDGNSGIKNPGVEIYDCSFHEALGTGSGDGFGLRIGNLDNVKILNTDIYNVGIDGIYAVNVPGIEIAYSNIHHVNMIYFTHPDQGDSSGDGIQLGGWYGGFHIHHNVIDRNDKTANKFSIIFNSAPGESDSAPGIVEYNTFKTGSNIAWAIHIERGKGIITRYNTFEGGKEGIRIAGQYTSDNLIYGNIFYNSAKGIGVNSTFIKNVAYPAKGTKIYNNTFYNVGQHIWLQGTHVDVKNNIHYRVGSSDVAILDWPGSNSSWTVSNNCYNTAAAAGTPGTGTNPVIANPMFVNGPAYNFHLQSSSPCIDTGATLSLPYMYDLDGTSIPQGPGPDIGAYEYR